MEAACSGFSLFVFWFLLQHILHKYALKNRMLIQHAALHVNMKNCLPLKQLVLERRFEGQFPWVR